MKFLRIGAIALAATGCTELAGPSNPSTEDKKAEAGDLVALCLLDYTSAFAAQPGSPTELGALVAMACREDIALAALIYADGDSDQADTLAPEMAKVTARNAALRIAKLRAS